MRINKKSLLLSFAIILLTLFVGGFIIDKVSAETVDTEGPTVTSISIDSHTYNPGDRVALSLNINDNVSGVKWVWLSYYGINPSTTHEKIDAYYSNNEWYMTIPENMIAGTYKLELIQAFDNAMNMAIYTTHAMDTNTDTKFGILSWDMNLTINTGSSDTEPPVVSEVTFDKTDLQPGETTKIKVKITDNRSGVRSATLLLNEVGQILQITDVKLSYDSQSGYYVGEYTASNVKKSYELYNIYTSDNADNNSSYYAKGVNQAACYEAVYQFCSLGNVIINVNGNTNDKIAPTVEKVYFDKENVSAPSTIDAFIKAKDDDSGLSSLASLIVQRVLSDGTYAINSGLGAYLSDNMTYNSETGLYETTFNINQYNAPGTYVVVSATLQDNAGNKVEYKASDLSSTPISFQIVKSLNIDLVTGTTSKDIIASIQNADDYANIMIDSTSSSIISKDIFEAIKGTDKTIYVETQGVQWVFNGKDITDSKDIDVTAIIEMISQNDSHNISSMLDKAITISFADNGKLPGKALIRVKADYAFRDYIGVDDLKIYYYDETGKVFKQVKLSAALTEDGFYEFYINHNSTFVIANKAPDSKYVLTDLADLSLNDSSIVLTDKTFNLMNYLLYGAIGIALVTAVVIIVVIKKKKSHNKEKLAIKVDPNGMVATEPSPEVKTTEDNTSTTDRPNII